MDKEKYIKDRFDINSLFEIGFIDTKTDFDKIEKRIVDFFELQNIFEFDNLNKPKNEFKVENIFSNN